MIARAEYRRTNSDRPIRVCHVMSADLWAGAEVQLATTASYLVEQPELRLTAVLLNDGRLARELRTLGVEVAVVDEHQHTPYGILTFLMRFLRAHRVDIVHTHRYKDTVLGMTAAKLTGVPHVIRTVHGLTEPMRGWDRTKFQAYTALDKAALRWGADRVVAVSRDLACTLATSGYGRSAIIHIHNGIDLRQVRAARPRDEVRRTLGMNPKTLLIGTAGRLSPVKAHDDLLRAARLILRQETSARFLIAGDGPLRDELLAMAGRLGIERECLFVGPRADVYDLVAAMDIFMLPSLHEGIPMALLEAMALGRPVIATAVGGVPEIVTHRNNGLLVEPRDAQALAAACLELAADRQWAASVGARARCTVEREFSHTVNGQALADEYRAVVAGTGGPIAGGSDVSSPRRGDANIGALRLSWALTRGLLHIAGRRVSRVAHTAAERRRMKQIRQHPAMLTDALRSARKILIVCQGNIIRSPFAANLVTQALGDRGVSISSGGLAAVPGKPPHPTALHLATSRQVDLSGHSASPVAAEAVATSDVIFVMDIPQLVLMRARFPAARRKTFLLACLATDAPLEIRDPVGGDESRFQQCFDHISRAVRPIVGTLSRTAMSQ